MRSLLITASLLLFISGTRTQDGFDLSDAFDDATPKPKEPTKSPEKPKPHDGFDLGDALLPGPKTTKKPSVPSGGGGGGGDGFDLGDALLPGPKTTKKPSVPSGGGGGGGGSFNDDDLLNTLDDGYQPDKTGSRGRAADYDTAGGADQPQEAGSGPMAGILSAIGVALVGAASSYFAYQKKKLCFKLQGGTDPESGKGHAGTQAEPQVLSNLLQSN